MKYDKILEAIFIERPNRFIARVKILRLMKNWFQLLVLFELIAIIIRQSTGRFQ